MVMKRLNQFLYCRNGNWHYVRRVPSQYAHFDERSMIRCSLKTTSLELARRKRDDLAEADESYWSNLERRELETVSGDLSLSNDIAMYKYISAKKRAMARGYMYAPTVEISESIGLNEILARLTEALKPTSPQAQQQEVEALLGGARPATPNISKAFEIYCRDLAIGDLKGKSATQKATWRKVKLRAVNNFIKLCGDLPMDKITRKNGRDFYMWWGKRINPSDGTKPLHPNSANRDIGNLRKLFRVYWEYEGEESRENPFRNLRYTDNVYKVIPPFENSWVRTKFLKRDTFKGLNLEATLLVYTMIETGCRPSELANLRSENIHLDKPIPYIEIKATAHRELKSNSASRTIPLVGVALQAMKLAPNGFPHYKNKEGLLSSSLLKTFRRRGLFPTKDHRIYSLRHSFEKRMLEAEIDHDLRCTLMGHSNARPKYGDGGSLEYRRDQLLKIAHPIETNFIETLTRV